MTKTGLAKASFLFALVWFTVFLSGCVRTPEVIKISGGKMGTTYHITIVAEQPAPSDLAEQIDAVLTQVDQSMSTYKPESELSQFNGLAAGQSMTVSEGLWEVLAISKTIWQQSDGSFDPTIGPAVDLWGFGPVQTYDRVPSEEEIAQTLLGTGYQHLLMSDDRTISKDLPIRLDLSAVAKGYAVDQVADLLESLALPDYLVEIGGEMRVSGLNPEGGPWRVAVESPDASGTVDKILPLHNVGVATSGDYRNYFEKDGKRYSHTIDPKTGAPITHNLASVTVIATRCADADAWATAFLVMGPEQALSLANKLSIPLYMLVHVDGQFKPLSSDSFNRYLEPEQSVQGR